MRGNVMIKIGNLRATASLLAFILLSLGTVHLSAQNSQVMGEVQFDGDTQLDRDSGVWIDGNYVGYVKELKGKKKVLLLPGKHQIVVKQSGYADFTRDIVVEPRGVVSIDVSMKLLPGATTPDVTSELKINVQPKRAAVF